MNLKIGRLLFFMTNSCITYHVGRYRDGFLPIRSLHIILETELDYRLLRDRNRLFYPFLSENLRKSDILVEEPHHYN